MFVNEKSPLCSEHMFFSHKHLRYKTPHIDEQKSLKRLNVFFSQS